MACPTSAVVRADLARDRQQFASGARGAPPRRAARGCGPPRADRCAARPGPPRGSARPSSSRASLPVGGFSRLAGARRRHRAADDRTAATRPAHAHARARVPARTPPAVGCADGASDAGSSNASGGRSRWPRRGGSGRAEPASGRPRAGRARRGGGLARRRTAVGRTRRRRARAGGRGSRAARPPTSRSSLRGDGTGKKTPPCAEALVAAGVARVVYAAADPNPARRGAAARGCGGPGSTVEGRCCPGGRGAARRSGATPGPAAVDDREVGDVGDGPHLGAPRARAAGSPADGAERARRTRCADGARRCGRPSGPSSPTTRGSRAGSPAARPTGGRQPLRVVFDSALRRLVEPDSSPTRAAPRARGHRPARPGRARASGGRGGLGGARGRTAAWTSQPRSTRLVASGACSRSLVEGGRARPRLAPARGSRGPGAAMRGAASSSAATTRRRPSRAAGSATSSGARASRTAQWRALGEDLLLQGYVRRGGTTQTDPGSEFTSFSSRPKPVNFDPGSVLRGSAAAQRTMPRAFVTSLTRSGCASPRSARAARAGRGATGSRYAAFAAHSSAWAK